MLSTSIKPLSTEQTSNGIINGSNHHNTPTSSSPPPRSYAGDSATAAAATIEKLEQIIIGLKDELHSLKDLVKKHERRIFKLETERSEAEVDGDSND